MNPKSSISGFTLIEIVVIIGVIVALASLAVPVMLRARVNANELAAITTLRTISNACQCYYYDASPQTYPDDLLTLSSTTPAYIDSGVADAVDADHAKEGYYFDYSLINNAQFRLLAWPAVFGSTGARNFFINEVGLITYTSENGLVPDQNSLEVE